MACRLLCCGIFSHSVKQTMNAHKQPGKNILLVEDNTPTRQHLTKAINNHPQLKVTHACSCLQEGLQALSQQAPDVLVTDLGLPDGSGIELIRAARQLDENIAIMVITVFGDERNVLSAIEAGASSYLLKDGDTDYIADAILKLLNGESPISAAIARQLLKRYQYPNQTTLEPAATPNPHLTEREVEVLACMAKGYTYNEAADILGMSSHTVTSHIKKIYRKLEVNSRGEAVYEAIQLGLVDLH